MPVVSRSMILRTGTILQLLALLSYLSQQSQLLVTGLPCIVDGSDAYYNESIIYIRKRRFVQFNSCPNHIHTCQHETCGNDASYAQHRSMAIEIPLFPHLAATTTYVTNQDTPIGVALNGVMIYGSTWVSNYTATTASTSNDPVDACGGTDSFDGVYKYRNLPTCLLLQLGFKQTSHSPQVGWSFDGFPIYGPIGFKGVQMMRCGRPGAHPEACLDECNGFFGILKNVDEFKYRYYLPGGGIGNAQCSRATVNRGACPKPDNPCCINVLPASDYYPLSPSCFKGCPYTNKDCMSTTSRGVSPNFYPAITNYTTAVFTANSTADSTNSTVPGDPTALPTTSPAAPSNYTQVPIPPRDSQVLIRFPFNDSYAIMSKAYSVNSMQSVLTIDHLPVSSKGAYISGLAVDTIRNRVYFTTKYGVFSVNEDGGDMACLISGYVPITIQGYNLDQVESIYVGTSNPQPCTTIQVIDSHQVQCNVILTNNRYASTEYQDYQTILDTALDLLVMNTRNGNIQAPVVKFTNVLSDAQPFSIDDVISQSGRPVITSVIAGDVPGSLGFEAPFRPHAIQLSKSPLQKFVYISDFSANSILAIDTDVPNNINVVKTQVRKVYSLVSILLTDLNPHSLIVINRSITNTSNAFSNEVLFYIDSSRGVVACTVPVHTDSSASKESHEIILLQDVLHLKSLSVEPSPSSNNVFVFVLLVDGTVISINVDEYFRVEEPFKFQPYASLSVDKTWLKIAKCYGSTSKSRFHSIFTVPTNGFVAPTSPLVTTSNYERLLRRVVVSNTNEDSVLTLLRSQRCSDTEQPSDKPSAFRLCSSRDGNALVGSPSSSSSSRDIMWPTAITGHVSGSDGVNNYTTLYVAEFLGKVWKLTVAMLADPDLNGIQPRDIWKSGTIVPLIDLSDFSSSQFIRSRQLSLSNPLVSAVVSHDARELVSTRAATSIFFEVVE